MTKAQLSHKRLSSIKKLSQTHYFYD